MIRVVRRRPGGCQPASARRTCATVSVRVGGLPDNRSSYRDSSTHRRAVPASYWPPGPGTHLSHAGGNCRRVCPTLPPRHRPSRRRRRPGARAVSDHHTATQATQAGSDSLAAGIMDASAQAGSEPARLRPRPRPGRGESARPGPCPSQPYLSGGEPECNTTQAGTVTGRPQAGPGTVSSLP